MRKRGPVTMLVLLVLTAGCGEPPAPAAEDLLYFQTPKGVTVLAAGAQRSSVPTEGVPATDWASVVTAEPHRIATHVSAIDPLEGDEQWRRSIEGPRLQVKVVSAKGEMVALTPLSQYHYSQGRKSTTIVVAGRDTEPQTVELEGNYEPEAFSTDGKSVFLLQFLPARAPTSYQVRPLDLTTEKVLGVYSVDAELQEAMRGTARIQSMSPDGKFLYTLYTTGGGRLGPRRAFIHVLNLDELWAHCIDLPPEFGKSPEPAISITSRPDGGRLYVADSLTGAVAEVDTSTLEVLGTELTGFGGRGSIGLHDGRETLYLAAGAELAAIDTGTLDERTTWTFERRITGLQMSADGAKLYVGLRDEVVTLDPSTGKTTGTIRPPGVRRITRMGPVMRSVQESIDKIVCAC